MEKLFVSREIAKKLKEKGFNEPCMKGVNAKEDFTVSGFGLTNQGNTHEFTLPLFQQATEWFRVKHKINIFAEPFCTKESELSWFGRYGRLNKTMNDCFLSHLTKKMYYDYNEALSAAIEEALKLI